MTGIPVIDLFAGAGGLSLGVAQAGGDVRLSVELDGLACETLTANQAAHGGRVLSADVCDLSGSMLRESAGLGNEDPLIIVGGPPCQPFSKAAYWTDPGLDARYRRARARGQRAPKPTPITAPKPDSRRDLLAEFRRLVTEANADGFLFENVPSILHPRNRATFRAFLQSLERNRYEVSFGIVNAVDYGVPQRRRRVVVLGCKVGRVPLPAPTHGLERQHDMLRLPAATTGAALAPYQGDEYSEPEEIVRGKWAEQLQEVPPGMNYKALTAWAGHPSPVFVAETRFWHFLLKLDPGQPSWTIAASPGPWIGPFHWSGRRLRTAELAALQGFPPGYRFCGSRRERVRQIGNAMPAPLARAMARPLLEVVADHTFALTR